MTQQRWKASQRLKSTLFPDLGKNPAADSCKHRVKYDVSSSFSVKIHYFDWIIDLQQKEGLHITLTKPGV